MTPTFAGRLQTRLLLAVVVGLPMALLASLVLGGLGAITAVLVLGVVTVLGVGWECVDHALQQRRWEGDWPAPLALGAGVVEGLIDNPVVHLLGIGIGFGHYCALFAMAWGVPWLVGRGPLAVFLPGWQHRGLRVVPASPGSGVARAPRVRRTPSLPRPSRQQLVVLGGFAAMVAAVVLLAPLVGPHERPARETPVAHDAEMPQPHLATVAGARTWDTRQRVTPTGLSFAAVGVDDAPAQVRMTNQGTLGTPRGEHAAWFAQGAAPGQRGPAVFIGDAKGVFAKLGSAQAGQRFSTTRADGSKVTFVVDEVDRVAPAQFPTRRVYGRSLKPLARLISYDTATGRNVIVFAHAVSVTTTAMRG
ncbi:sortase domain-containing protein [Nocardioides montaniterrae]